MLHHSAFFVTVEGKKKVRRTGFTAHAQVSECCTCMEVTVKSRLGYKNKTGDCVAGVVFDTLGTSLYLLFWNPKIIGFILQHL